MSSEVTVKQLATTVGIPVERLLAQLHEAGIKADTADALITEPEKVQLLTYLRRSHGKHEVTETATPERVTIQRKSMSELRQTAAAVTSNRAAATRPNPAQQRASKTVSVEVRRKRTYVRRSEAAAGESPIPAAPEVAPSVAGAEAPVMNQPPPAVPVLTDVMPPTVAMTALPAVETAPVPPSDDAPAVTVTAAVATPPSESEPSVSPTSVSPTSNDAPVSAAPAVTAKSTTAPAGRSGRAPANTQSPTTGRQRSGQAANKPAGAGAAPGGGRGSRRNAPAGGAGRPAPDQRRQAAPVDGQRRRAELEARRAEDDARRLAEREDLDRQQKKDEARRRADEEERRRLAEEARRLAEEEARLARLAAEQQRLITPVVAVVDDELVEEIIAPRPPVPPVTSKREKPLDVDADDLTVKPVKKHVERLEKEKEKVVKKAPRKDVGRGKRLDTVAVDYEEEDVGEAAPVGRSANRRRKKPTKPQQLVDKHGFQRPTAPMVREVAIPDTISVGELASRMSVKVAEVIKELFKQGMMVTINQVLDRDTATIVVEELGHKAVAFNEQDAEDTLLAFLEAEQEQATRLPRPPVVTIMGHVDHGKTSLLDYIRRTRVAAGEAGGITQHIGAYHVETPKGAVCFLDTPGHAAFSAMRARGAQVTDVVILVVAADDGVMPQTVEAINHARASNVPVVVAVNKMDKPGANPDRLMQELTQYALVAEEWGGETMMVKVSAKTGLGIDELLDAVLLQAEVLELTAPLGGSAHGTIIESSLEKGRGPVATVLVQSGTLRTGDMLVSGCEYGRVRALFNETGQQVQSAGPSIPVQVLGLSGAPNAGDDVIAVVDEKRAREVAELRQQRERQSKMDEQRVASLDKLFSQFKEGEAKSVNLILKADVQGSVEALRSSLLQLTSDEVKVNIVASGVGGLTESDANLAVTSHAILLGFNVRADAQARRIIEEKGLDLRYYSIIYELIGDVKQAISGLLSPIVTEEIIGLAEVRDVFRSSKFGAIAGCMVTEGAIRRNNPIRVLRNHVVVFTGALESLRRFKDDVQEVKAGIECGIGVKNYNDVQVGDHIEVFERTERAREL
ncbi:translation initiation factor IF-2 [Rhodoferax sp. 4810]|uniref:Translation initiation factor IF-2 n=1 Tax=Thiospirillum jenense TaxID=1653858 RepID=A0A839H8Q6_9GAMM|nr:translation initiation factor IF-2 [Rhodoferax jenense]MBB1125481.1 translation initiation factor IF-2 [Thiospirillum jenense]